MLNIQKLHEEAMDYSFRAKQDRDLGLEDSALKLYEKASEIESEVAEFYLDKPEWEPTRSILIRSAAFLNLKAGKIENAEKFIFAGLSNQLDKAIKEQLYQALELCLAYRNAFNDQISRDVDYIFKLRQKSLMYSIEPKKPIYAHAATLEMVTEFSINYIKSLKAYSKSQYKRIIVDELRTATDIEHESEEFQDQINPIITSAGFGSFKFAIATDWLPRLGEKSASSTLKSNIIIRYHNEIFSKPLSSENIAELKDEYSDEEINSIFRPLLNITSKKSDFKVSYYDRNSLKKTYVPGTGSKLKKDLLPVRNLSIADIGKLENTISHKRTNDQGGFSTSVLLKQELKSYSFDYPTKLIDVPNQASLILTNEVIVNVGFSSEIGFVFSLEELPIEISSTVFNTGLAYFYDAFINLIKALNSKIERSLDEEAQWVYIKGILTNPELII